VFLFHSPRPSATLDMVGSWTVGSDALGVVGGVAYNGRSRLGCVNNWLD